VRVSGADMRKCEGEGKWSMVSPTDNHTQNILSMGCGEWGRVRE
jgi:hypothetical protein